MSALVYVDVLCIYVYVCAGVYVWCLCVCGVCDVCGLRDV